QKKVRITRQYDVTPPELTCAGNKEIECNATIKFDDPTAKDNCTATADIKIEVVSTSADGLTRTWKATDACKNVSTTCSQTITVKSCVHIFPTNTDCASFSNGTAVGLPKVCTSDKDNNGLVDQNVNPGVFFYYSFVTVPPGAFTIDVKQINDSKLDKLFTIQGYSDNTSQIRLTTSSCGTVSFTPSFIDSGSGARLAGTNSSSLPATYIVSIKYETKSIVDGDYSGTNTSSTYTFASYVNGLLASGTTGTINAEVCNTDSAIAPIAPIASKTETAGFTASPVPFKDQLTIRYDFDYVSDVKIEVFNSQGRLVLSKTDTNSYLNKEVTLKLNSNIDKAEVYVVKVTTNRGSSVKKVISSK
ncbi:T9SS type A sorting domain-containing protein, partial [Flavobacterium rhamnosiphilum]